MKHLPANNYISNWGPNQLQSMMIMFVYGSHQGKGTVCTVAWNMLKDKCGKMCKKSRLTFSLTVCHIIFVEEKNNKLNQIPSS